MASRHKDLQFVESSQKNRVTYQYYLELLKEIAVSRFIWDGLPDTVDPRFLEMSLLTDGQAIFFNDEDIGYLALKTMTSGQFDLYGVPIDRTAYASNGYQKSLKKENSVIIYNNMLRTPTMMQIEMFAGRLTELDRVIDVNIRAQKTPIVLICDEKQRLTLKNLYKEYDGNAPFIFGDKNLDLKQVTSINTGAPYVADKIYQQKTNIWNEFLTYIGVPNLRETKKERLIQDEVARSLGGTIAARNSALNARQQAADEINRMFNIDISVKFNYNVNGDNQAAIGGEDDE